MTALIALLAVVAGSAAALLCYLVSPQQQWLAGGPWTSRYRGWCIIACVLTSLLAMLCVLAPLEAVFAWSVLLMFVWSLAPFLGAWRAARRRARSPA